MCEFNNNLISFNTTGYMLPLRLWLVENERNSSWLARKLSVSPSSVHYWFEGKHRPSKKHIEKIFETTGVEL